MATRKKTSKKKASKKTASKKKAPKKYASPARVAVNPRGIPLDTEPTIPSSRNGAKQAGRVSAAERVYKAGTHNVVSPEEAQRLLDGRKSGEIPLIEDGLDTDGGEDYEGYDLPDDVVQAIGFKQEDAAEDFSAPKDEDYDPLGAQQKVAQAPVQAPAPAAAVAPPPITPASNAFLQARTRVSLELADGTMILPAISTIPCQYGVTILLPLSEEGVTFIPKAGSEITVNSGENSWKCFFPGTHFEVPELNMIGLSFVRADN